MYDALDLTKIIASMQNMENWRFCTRKLQQVTEQSTYEKEFAKPEVLVARADQAFDGQGNLVDQAARGFLRDLLAGLADWTERVSRTERAISVRREIAQVN